MGPSPPVSPEKPSGAILASGQTEPVGRLERVELALPKVHVLHGLDVPDQGKALLTQLSSGPAFRVELPARDATRGFERVRQALVGIKTHLTADAGAAARLAKPAFRSDFAVFIENITPELLAAVLRRAGNADKAAAQRKASDRYFEGPLVVKEMARWDRKELSDLLGIDPVRVRPAPKPAAIDIRKPLDEVTAGQVQAALDGKGNARPGPGEAIVLPLGHRGKSAELRRFLEMRQPARPGTLQVLLIVRNVG
jgi:hypothetical protein